MKNLVLIAAAVSTLGLSACNTTQNWGGKQTIGTGAGAIAGGLLGSQVGKGSGQLWATGAGVLLGALVGSEIGSSLDNADRIAAEQASSRAMNARVGETITWNNPNSGNYGSYTPVREGQTAAGAYCREYQQTIVVGGKTQSGYGQACQQPDGSWRVVN
jgi:surface antigen